MNDDGSIIDGKKILTNTELESSVLFEVPKEKNSRDDATSANDNSIVTSTHMNEITNNNISQEEKSSCTFERNPDQLSSNNHPKVTAHDVNPKDNSDF